MCPECDENLPSCLYRRCGFYDTHQSSKVLWLLQATATMDFAQFIELVEVHTRKNKIPNVENTPSQPGSILADVEDILDHDRR